MTDVRKAWVVKSRALSTSFWCFAVLISQNPRASACCSPPSLQGGVRRVEGVKDSLAPLEVWWLVVATQASALWAGFQAA